ncbi:MAG TPA: NUDIX domain-containing protein [Gaiellales bacterium]|nr:NUDIX domain-containing protein [Gaiellales bacterium]
MPEVTARGPRAGADALVQNQRGEVLLVRRADDGRWAMPGGWVDPGEMPEQAVVREVAEETGLQVSAPRLVHSERRPQSVHHTFRCRLDGGRLQVSDESLEVAFLAPDDVGRWHADHRERLLAAMAVAE